MGTLDGFVPLLAGDMEWGRTLSALRRIGYAGPLTVEVPPYPLAAVSAAVDQRCAAGDSLQRGDLTCV